MEKFAFDVVADGNSAKYQDILSLAELAKQAIIGGFGVQVKHSLDNKHNEIVIETVNDHLLLHFLQKEYDPTLTLSDLHEVHKVRD